MSRKEELLERLPFYWDGDNVESLMSIMGSSLDDIDNTLDDIKSTRRIQKINDEDAIAVGQHLDYLAQNVGQSRDVVKFIDDKLDIDVESENDEMFRRRVLWNIRLQESDGLLEQIKGLLTEGLIMYRVRTGLGGYVPRDLISAEDFITDIPPKWNIPESQDMGDRRYVEPSDIYIFHNEEPRLGMSAPDSWHGKYGDLTNYYQVEIPWKAMPWSEGEESLIWRSQDDFPRPYFVTFTSDDLDGGILSIDHGLDNDYPSVSITNSDGVHVDPDSVTKTSSGIDIDVSGYTVEETWMARLTGYGYRRPFESSDMDGDIMSISHNLGVMYPNIAIYDDSGTLITPDNINFIDDNNIEIDLTSFSVSGIWHATVLGGDDVISKSYEFDNSDVVVDELTIQHTLPAETLEVSIVNENGEVSNISSIQELSNQRIRLFFLSEDQVSGTWNIRLTSAKGKIPTDNKNGWNHGVWTGPQEDLHIEPLKELAELTRPAATEVGMFGYGGVIWRSQDDFDDPSSPPRDKHHGWGSRWDGDIEETLYAMENLDGFWVNYNGGAE